MSLFKKKKAGNIRGRISAFDDEEEDDGSIEDSACVEAKTTANGSTIKKKKKKEFNRPAVNALSFEDDLEADDGIPFQEKKSTLSYKLRREMKKERREKRKEEKEKFDPCKRGGIAELDELGIKIVNGREAEAIGHQPGDSDSDSDSFFNKSPRPTFRAGTDKGRGGKITASSRQTNAGLNPLKDILQSGCIPDANTIHFIRKQRQQARERGEFVPLDESGTESAQNRKSRLVREDDSDRDDDDGGADTGGLGGGRIRFSDVKIGGEGKGGALSLVEARAMVAYGRPSSAGSDDEDTSWESQQMQKASGKLSTDGSMTTSSFSFGSALPPPPTLLSSSVSSGASAASVSKPSVPVSQLDAIQLLSSRPGVNYQAEGIMKRLRDSRTSLQEVHRRHEHEYRELQEELDLCHDTVVSCESSSSGLAAAFQLYQALRGYVTDLTECLNEKMPGLEELELRVLSLYKQRTDKLLARRRQDVTDQNDELSPFSNEAVRQCPQRARRAAEREGRRTRRRRERERGAVRQQHHDGISTDDELPTQETQEFSSKLEAVAKDSERLFEDVEEDFSSLEAVLRQMDKWRRVAPDTYQDAYVAENIAKMVEAFVRIELLMWNPLHDGVELERLSWFSQLVMYAASGTITSSYGSGSVTLKQLAQDPDRHLVSQVIERVVLNKLKDLVSAYWDPLSHSQTVRLVNLVRHYTTTCPTVTPSSKHLKNLCNEVLDKINSSIDKDVFIPIFTKTAYESRTSQGSLFFQRQFWIAWKFMSLILMWHKVLGEQVLFEHAVRGVLNPYLIPALNIACTVSLRDGLEKTQCVIQAMPREWTKWQGGTGAAHPFLCNLESFLANISQRISVDQQNEESLREVKRLLLSVGASRAGQLIQDKYLSCASPSND